MFGYGTDETEECMPLTVILAHRLNQKIAELRRSGALSWARPDSKTQVSIKLTEFTFIRLAETLDGGCQIATRQIKHLWHLYILK